MSEINYFTLENVQSYLDDKDIYDIIDDSKVIERSKERIMRSIHSGTTGFSFEEDYSSKSITTYPDTFVEAASIPVSRIMISVLDDSIIINNFSKAEARTLVDRVKKNDDSDLFSISQDLGLSINRKRELEVIGESFFGEVIEENFEKPAEEKYEEIIKENKGHENEFFEISYDDYIRNSHNSSTLSLPSSNFFNGRTYMTKKKLEEFIYRYILNEVKKELPYDVDNDIKQKVEEHVEEIESNIPEGEFEYEIDRVEEDLMPPLIKKLAEDVRRGKNLMHMERFTLASFLINIGMTDEEIIEFLGIPDIPDDRIKALASEKTKYQLNHIRTEGIGEAYVTPTYEKIKSWGIEWEKDDLEKKINNPLVYYKIKLKDQEKEKD